MGVKECGRIRCSNILCDRCILNGRVYICNSCYCELLSAKERWIEEKVTVGEIRDKIIEFMANPPNSSNMSTDPEDIQKEFNKLVGVYDD